MKDLLRQFFAWVTSLGDTSRLRAELDTAWTEIHRLRAELGAEVSSARQWHTEDAQLLSELHNKRMEDQARYVKVHERQHKLMIYINRLEAVLTEHSLALPPFPNGEHR